MAAEANVDFENENNFDAYNAGNGKIHVKVLLFSERGYDHNAGRGNNQSLGNNPDPTCDATGCRLYTQAKNGDQTIQLHYWADNYYNNTGAKSQHQWPKDKGVVWVQMWGGVIECTNTYDGLKRTVVADGTVAQIELKRKDEGYHLTWFEFDWYPPESMDEEDFKLFVTTDHHKWNQSSFRTKTYDFGVFSGANEQMAPTICDPFLYAANTNGAAGYGKLATVFTSMSEVKTFYTSQDLTEHALAGSSGMIYIEPTDTVIRGFRVRFYEKRSSDNTTWRWVWTNKVDVPAYHRIHDFAIGPYQYLDESNDKWYEDFRYKQLKWLIHYPMEEDVMEGDVFEIQRAYRSDFSDAVSLDVVPMEYDSLATVNDIQTYSYVDSTEAAWWNPVENSYNIYYRVRRASSAIWGWTPGAYNAVDTFSITSPYEEYTPGSFSNDASYNYTLDDDFANNRAVHFTWEMDNGNFHALRDSVHPGYSYYYWDDNQRLILRKILLERNDTILIEIPQEIVRKAYDSLNYIPWNTEYAKGYVYVHYTDYANTPCTHYKYETYIDTTNVVVKYLKGRDAYTTAIHPVSGPEIYYTEAANINAFTGTDKEYSEYVLLTWDPTEGETGTYTLEARPHADSTWRTLVSGMTDSWYRDTYADPAKGDPWQYRLTMTYDCNGTTLTSSAETTGRRNPYGKISGRIAYADGTGCPDIEVNASRVTDGVVIQRVRTDENGYYLLDSVPYGGSPQYAVTPVSQTAEFRYNNTSATFATITLSLDRCVAQNIDFENISSVRVSGRVLYENSTIPVRDANPPYDAIDENKYPHNMSLCAQVKLGEDYDTDENDIVYALYHNECVGMANVNFDELSNISNVSITVHGNDEMNRQAISFQLWQASTGKVFDLTVNRSILFAHGYVYGCGDEQPLQLTTGGSLMQNIELPKGWSWISTNLNLEATKGAINSCLIADVAWTEGDEIKAPALRQFSSYNSKSGAFEGELTNIHFSQMYMWYTKAGNTIRISGESLPEDSMKVTFRGDGQWNALPCLLDQTTWLVDALAGYYDMASPGDLIKAHDRFATFSKDGKWVGDLASMRPGEGYLFRRLAPGTVTVPFYLSTSTEGDTEEDEEASSNAPKRNALAVMDKAGFSNPNAASNMTMIAKINAESSKRSEGTPNSEAIHVYVGDELAAVAKPITIEEETFYFLTIQSDKTGALRFEMEGGQVLTPINAEGSNRAAIHYVPDAHAGSLTNPVELMPGSDRPYKILENQHVIIIRNNEKYDITGKKL